MQTQRIAELPQIGTCAECLNSGILVERDRCAVCVGKGDAYDEGLRQAALESLYTAVDNLLAGGWNVAQIGEAIRRRPECAVKDFTVHARAVPNEIGG